MGFKLNGTSPKNTNYLIKKMPKINNINSENHKKDVMWPTKVEPKTWELEDQSLN